MKNPPRFAVIDDIGIYRDGVRVALERLPIEVAASMDFEDAMARTDWSDLDFVLCDVADDRYLGGDEGDAEPTRDDDFPSIKVIEHIQECCRLGKQPTLIAVTGQKYVWEEDLVRRRVREAEVDHFVYRNRLDELLTELVGQEADSVSQRLKSLPPVKAPDEITDLGITKATRVNQLIDVLISPFGLKVLDGKIRGSEGKRDSEKLAQRAKGAAHEIDTVNVRGEKVEGDEPRLRTLRRIRERGTRVARQPNRG